MCARRKQAASERTFVIRALTVRAVKDQIC